MCKQASRESEWLIGVGAARFAIQRGQIRKWESKKKEGFFSCLNWSQLPKYTFPGIYVPFKSLWEKSGAFSLSFSQLAVGNIFPISTNIFSTPSVSLASLSKKKNRKEGFRFQFPRFPPPRLTTRLRLDGADNFQCQEAFFPILSESFSSSSAKAPL